MVSWNIYNNNNNLLMFLNNVDLCIVLASDGIYDVMSSEEVVSFVSSRYINGNVPSTELLTKWTSELVSTVILYFTIHFFKGPSAF